MSVGFGFSVGDFIAAIGLVRDVIDALQDSGTARIRYKRLLQQLYGLETALQHVNRLGLDDVEKLDGVDQISEIDALREAAAQCQRSIEGFFKRIENYTPCLGEACKSKNGSSWKSALKKVQWAVCHKDDVSRLQADLLGHTESINLLLATIQLKRAQIGHQRQESRHQSLSRRIQGSYFGCMRKLAVIFEGVNMGVHQGKRLLELTTNIVETNVRIFQTILSIHHQLLSIPGQIERQQPVFLIDALGRTCPFHLEFVRSAKALVSVLETNFEQFGRGAEKIRRNEFAIEDAATKEDIDLTNAWETCFQPGQRVEMSMLFNWSINESTRCPRCGYDCQGEPDLEIICSNCGISFRHVTEMEDLELIPEPMELDADMHASPPTSTNASKLKRRRRPSDNDEMAPFRKVRIRSWAPLRLFPEDSAPMVTTNKGDVSTAMEESLKHPVLDEVFTYPENLEAI